MGSSYSWWTETEPSTRLISGSRNDVGTSVWEETNSWRAHTTAGVAREAAVRWWLMTELASGALVLHRLYAVVLEGGYLVFVQGPPRLSICRKRLQCIGLHVTSFHVWLQRVFETLPLTTEGSGAMFKFTIEHIIIIIIEKTEAGLERPLYPRNRYQITSTCYIILQ